MKRVFVVHGVLVVVLGAGFICFLYSYENDRYTRHENHMDKLEKDLSQIEAQLQAATGGNPNKKTTEASTLVLPQLTEFAQSLAAMAMACPAQESDYWLISKQRKQSLTQRIESLSERFNVLLDKYEKPLGLPPKQRK